MSQSVQYLTSDGDFLLNPAGEGVGPDGVVLTITVSGTNSLVLKKNMAAPGAAVSLVEVGYLNGSLAAQSAGTAITASGLAYVSREDAGFDLYGALDWTSGSVLVKANTASLGTAEDALAVTSLTAGSVTSSTSVTGATVVATTSATAPISLSTTSASVGAAAAGAAGATKLTKAVSAISNNSATTVLTITVPNAAHSATVRVTAIGVLGAGGAIGAGEANASNSYDITVVRTAGVAAVADISTAFGVNAAAVAGAATCTAALTVAAVVGAVGASNSFPVQITIVRSGGSSDNHTAVLVAEVLNQNATGVTIA